MTSTELAALRARCAERAKTYVPPPKLTEAEEAALLAKHPRDLVLENDNG